MGRLFGTDGARGIANTEISCELAIKIGRAAAMVLGLLLLTVGFWNTVWIALFGVAGGILGGVKDKKQLLKNVLNRIIPDKKTVPYREQHPDITQAVRDAAARGYKTSGGDEKESEQD